jgi:alpha 1,2-mannosyltransferase
MMYLSLCKNIQYIKKTSKMKPKPVKQVIQKFTEDFVRENNFLLNGREISELKIAWRAFADEIPPYPDTFKGRGIVVCAGGFLYLPCAWVLIAMLREQGCTLPIELWYEGNELNDEMILKLNGLNVICKNCSDFVDLPVRGYAMKPLAILHSSFREVLFLDADNNCLSNPEYLFENEVYRNKGSIFWPDAWTTSRSNMIWKIIGSTDYNSPEQESGQILINKEKCWKELNLAVYFNNNYSVYYKMLLGDKDTFKFAWQALNTPYFMISTPVGYCGYLNKDKEFFGFTMVQHDPSGEILFLHRNLVKWSVVNNEKAIWTCVKRKCGSKVKFNPKNIQAGNLRFSLVDIQGDVEVIPFKKKYGNYEARCLKKLQDLRKSKEYASFLHHLFLVEYRRGFMNDLGNLLSGFIAGS